MGAAPLQRGTGGMITCVACDSGYNSQLVREIEAVLAALGKLGEPIELWLLHPDHSTAQLPAEGFGGCVTQLLRWDCNGWCDPQKAAALLAERLPVNNSLTVFAGGGMAAVAAVVYAERRGLQVLTALQALHSSADGLVADKLVYAGCLQAKFLLPQQAVVTFANGALPQERPIGEPGGFTEHRVPLLSCPQLLSAEQVQTENPLPDAEVILAVGRGVASRSELEQLATLARNLGGQLAASRPVVMNGWLAQSRLLGISGEVAAPHVAIAMGISGSAAFLYGLRGAKALLAVNRDKDAPIFKHADYGLVEEWQTLSDRLQQEIGKKDGGTNHE